MIPGHSPARQPENRDEGPMTPGLAHEHGVLMRQMGGLQSRCTELLRSSASRVAALEGDNLRLRAELVLLRTSVFWGLGAATVLRRARPLAGVSRPPEEPGTREAQAVICQAGCVGHAHPWLEEDGQCRRSGLARDRVSDDAEADRS
jgi:hypothetical protein